MSRFVFNPITNELEYSKPRGVEIPKSAFKLNADPDIIILPRARRSPLLIVLIVILLIIFILLLMYLVWLWFIKTPNQSPTDVFAWIASF